MINYVSETMHVYYIHQLHICLLTTTTGNEWTKKIPKIVSAFLLNIIFANVY